MEIGNWVVVKTNHGNIEGIVTKVNTLTFIIRLQIAGQYKFIKQGFHNLVEIIDF